MAATLEALQKKIGSGEDLSSIVRTMKALAATSVRQYEKAAESLDDYYHTVELGLAVVLPEKGAVLPESPARRRRRNLVLLFGSDHGLAGRFNEQIVSYALDYYRRERPAEGKETSGQDSRDQNFPAEGAEQDGFAPEAAKVNLPGSETFPLSPADILTVAIGEQVISRLGAAGIDPAGSFHMPTSISAITPFIQTLLEEIEQRRAEEGVEKVLLFYNRPVSGGFSPRAEILLPVDLDRLRETRLKWQSRSLPTFTMPPAQLLSALLRQYFFVSLYRACALSLAAENTSRLAAMQAAEKNINERLAQLRTAYQQERQAAITAELLDIISGFKAVRG